MVEEPQEEVMKKFISPRIYFKISCLLILVSSVLLTGCAPALLRAANLGQVDTVKELLDKGADVNEWNGGTVLFAASEGGNPDVVKLLIERGANVNTMSDRGDSALGYAAIRGKTDVMKILIDNGANIDAAITGLERKSAILANYPDWVALYKMGIKQLEKIVKKQEISTRPAMPVLRPTQEVSPPIKSDVDNLPAIKTKPNKNAYAIVIGIEQYRQKLPKADFAVSDAKLVSEYLAKIMGYPEENIVTLTNENASKGDLEKYFDQWLKNVVEKNGTVFVYYSGHGAPNAVTGDAYLVPYDGDPAFIEQTGYSLKRLYENLAKLPAKNIIVALDSCFSGAGGKSVSAKGSRALVRVEKTSARNIAVLTASQDNQISSSYEDKGHGVFTYFLLKGIKEMLGEDRNSTLELGQLYNYIKPQVERTSRRLYNNEQTPQLMTADEQMKKIGLR
jgi:hypothetical protein